MAEWLPHRRPIVLIGDRGFRGGTRIRFLRQLGWHFVLRVTADTQAELPRGRKGRGCHRWETLAQAAPPLGARRQRGGVLLGKQLPSE